MAKFFMGVNEIEWANLIYRYPTVFYPMGTYTRAIPGSPNRRLHPRKYGRGRIVTNNMKDEEVQGHATKLNLKYVPKYIKNRDYRTFFDWFKAVFRFIDDSKTAAQTKAKVMTQQNKTANCLEFYDVDVNLQDVMNRCGFVPTELDYITDEARENNWTTENERNRAKGWLNLQYTKKLPKGQGCVKLRADVQGKQKVKLTVHGLTAANLQEVLTKVMETL